jgi:hypothetical protein
MAGLSTRVRSASPQLVRAKNGQGSDFGVLKRCARERRRDTNRAAAGQ